MKKNVNFFILIPVLIISLSLLSGCTKNTTQATLSKENDTLYQVSTINSLLAGNYDGLQTIGKLKEKGDIGIGTFDMLDGELVMIDKKVYQVKATGQVIEVGDSIKAPFAAVTFFDKDITKESIPISNFKSLTQELDNLIVSKELFYAFRIDGTFKYVKTRSVPKQNKPYQILSEVTKNQPTFEYRDVTGSLIGFWCPEYVGGVNVPGYHLHFISDDRTKGGHLLEISFDKASINIDVTDSFNMALSPESVSGAITDIQKEIDKVEK